ncbi:MAG: hypothetical protein IJQ70_04770 [Synergistaceae bacterium]|nr:hypothetical protein [Synergistaceae bacterium]
MQRRFALFTASTLAVFLTAGTAHAASLKGKDLSTVPDILRHARGLTGKEVSLELRKDSLLWLNGIGQLDLRYNIGNGDKDSSLGRIPKGDENSNYVPIEGIFLALAQTKFNGDKVAVASSRSLARLGGGLTNWFYNLYFVTVSNNGAGGGGG